MILVGTRVVRGPNWRWHKQNGNTGNVGTVTEVSGSSLWVFVKWDRRTKNCNYRTGYDKQYDLRIYNNANIGIVHRNIRCLSCGYKSIRGFRYKCNICKKFNLCARCYHKNKHSEHDFTLFDTEESMGIKLTSRLLEKKINCRSYSYYPSHLPILGMPGHVEIPVEQTVEVDDMRNVTLEQINWMGNINTCICCNKPARHNVTCIPCNHKVACLRCSSRAKNCFKCRTFIESWVTPDDRVFQAKPNVNIKSIESAIQRLTNNNICKCCFINQSVVVFKCLHKACETCSKQLEICYQCKSDISVKVLMF